MFFLETKSNAHRMSECEWSADKILCFHDYRLLVVMMGNADGCGGGERDKMKSRSKSLFISFTALHHRVCRGWWKERKENLFHYKVYSRKIINQMRNSFIHISKSCRKFLVLILDEWLMRDAPLFCGGVWDEEGWFVSCKSMLSMASSFIVCRLSLQVIN